MKYCHETVYIIKISCVNYNAFGIYIYICISIQLLITCRSRIPAQFRAVVTRSRLQETQWRPDRGVARVVEGGNKDGHRGWKERARGREKRVEAERERVWLVIGLQSGSPRRLTKWPGQIAPRLREYLYIQRRSQASRVFRGLVSDPRTHHHACRRV